MRRIQVNIKSHSEDGAALLVSLILLLVMALVGISSMGGAIFEVKMASTMQQEEVAFRRAERTLIVAENEIRAMTANSAPFEFATEDAFYTVSDTLNARLVDWSSLISGEGPVSSANSIDDDDAYVVHYLGDREITGETLAVPSEAPVAGAIAHIFRNTIRSSSGKNAVRIVESLYATSDAP